MAYARLLLPLLAAPHVAACSGLPDEDAGIYVGNPSMTALRLSSPSRGIDLDAAELDLGALQVDDCTDAETRDAHDAPHDLLGDTRYGIDAGLLCGVSIQMDGALRAAGTDAEGRAWSVDVPLNDIDVKVTGNVAALEDADLVLELGNPGWYRSLSGRPDHAKGGPGLAERLSRGTRLYVDPNRDGWLDDDERVGGPLGEAELR